MYGATEASARLSYLEPERYADKIDSIGKAIPGVSLRILDTNGEEFPPGQTGELVASGPNIMQSYWRDPDATSKALRGGWYHTGDQAYQDREGYFYVVGRKDDLLKVSGHRINPVEIEDTLMGSGLLAEVVVLGLTGDLLGQRLVALSVPRNGDFGAEKIAAYCAEKLPKYNIPSEFKIIRALPKSSSGKIDRTKCLEIFCSRELHTNS